MFSVHVAYLMRWVNPWSSVLVAVSGTIPLVRTYLKTFTSKNAKWKCSR